MGAPGGAELAHTTPLATGGAGIQIQVPRIQTHGPGGLLPVSPECRRERSGGCLEDATRPGWDTGGPDLGLNTQPTVGSSTLQSFFRARVVSSHLLFPSSSPEIYRKVMDGEPEIGGEQRSRRRPGLSRHRPGRVTS